MAVVYACGLFVARAGTDPRGAAFLGGKGCCGRADRRREHSQAFEQCYKGLGTEGVLACGFGMAPMISSQSMNTCSPKWNGRIHLETRAS